MRKDPALTTYAEQLRARFNVMASCDTLGMPRAEAIERIRALGAQAQALAACPACRHGQGSPCDAAEPWIHEARFLAAAARLGADRLPEDFHRLNALLFAAHPLPQPCGPEETSDGNTVLWRAARAGSPWLGRRSYWTHDRKWAEIFCCSMQLSNAWRVALWRTEAKITARNAYDQGELDMTTGCHGKPGQLDQAMRENPEWPGRTWLIFTANERDNCYPLTPERGMVQYCYCGRRPVKAERAT